MNDKNFDSLKNLKAPDSWIENALNIANAQDVQKEKPIFFIRYSRSLAAVACLILVCTISLLVVLNKNDGSVPAIDPDYETVLTDSTDNEDDSQTEHQSDATEKTNDKKDKNSITETVTTNGGAPHESTEKPQKPTQSQNTKPVKPTDKPETTPTDKDENPTDAPEVLPSPTVKPTRPQNSKPDMKPVNRPGNPGDPTNRPGSPGDPMKPRPTEGDGEGGAPTVPGVPYDVTFAITVDSYYLTSDEIIYCTLISPNNETVLIDKVADIVPYGSRAIASVSVSVLDLMHTGEYTCYFYSSNGYYIGSANEYV